MFDGETVCLESVFNEEIPNVNVLRVRAAGLASVLFESDGAFVILVKDVADDCVPLPFHELPCPNGIWEIIACADELGFRRALHVDPLFVAL